jgi:hypothetical protein
MRAYAATLPFVVALPMLGLRYRRQTGAWGDGVTAQRPGRGPLVWACAMCLLVLQGLGLFLVGASASLAPPPPIAASCGPVCEGSSRPIALYADPRIAVRLTGTPREADAGRPGLALDLDRLRDWETARRHSLWHMWRGISRLPADTTLALGFDLRRGAAIYLRSSSREFPGAPARVAVCGETAREVWIEWVEVRAWRACDGR